jgi:TonB family protein
VVTKVVPPYPAIARSMNLSGTVKLEALVLANGSVKAVQVKGGNPLLVQSAQRAVQDWKWEKADHESTEQVEFRFHP